MRKKIKPILCVLMTLCVTAVMLLGLTRLMERKSSVTKYEDFFAQKEDFDVLFFGTSHMLNGVFPMELWDEYGMVSYNFGGHASTLPTSYWVMKNALEYTTPKAVVIDCLKLSTTAKTTSDYSYLHLSMDAFPLNLTKIQAVMDLLDDPAMDRYLAEHTEEMAGQEEHTKIGLLWDFSVYHNRWDALETEDFNPVASVEKGAEARLDVVPQTFVNTSANKCWEGGSVGEEYLRRMIEECQAEGIDVVLTWLPYSASVEEQMEANYVQKIADEYGISYLNFLNMDLINYATDCYDEGSHLNPSGARKVTDYIGQFLVDTCQIPNQKENPAYAFWNEDYQEYTDFLDQKFIDLKSIYKYVMMLKRDKITAAIDLYNQDVLENEKLVNLLINLGVTREELDAGVDFILYDGATDTVAVLSDFRHEGATAETAFGTVHYTTSEDGKAYRLSFGKNKFWHPIKEKQKYPIRVEVYRDGVRVAGR